MKKIFTTLAISIACHYADAQTNIFPPSGNVGIGTTTPASKFVIRDDTGTSAASFTFSGNVSSGYSTTFSMDDTGVNIGHSSASRSLNLLTANIKRLTILEQGNVGIGTITPAEKLSVNGKIRAHEVKVETVNWPDYVFHKDYSLQPLPEVERFIQANQHLQGIPSASEVEKEGVSLGEMNAKLLKKIEELTLYMIEQNKRADKQDKIIELQQKEINNLKSKF